MRNIKIVIEYDGTNYSGWQYQPKRKTIQGEIEKVLKRIFREEIRVVGAGRTDAGVHAIGQVANFKLKSKMSVKSLKAALNGNLPRDIFVKDVLEVSKDFHARFDARSKLYQYRVLFGRSPLRKNFVWEIKYKIDLKIMKQGLRKFIGKHDFTNFSVANEKKNRICKIIKTDLKKHKNEIIIEIEGERFLNKMVRMIVGFVVDLGRGQFGINVLKRMFDRDFNKNFLVAPSQGLYLIRVTYPNIK